MITLLNHDYELTIGAAIGSSIAVVINKHHIEFEVTKDDKDGVKFKVDIYNLSPEEIDHVDTLGSDAAIFFKAGYESNTTLSIFKGNATSIFSNNEDGDDILTIHADASEIVLNSSWSSITIPASSGVVTRRDALRALLADIELESRANPELQPFSFQDLDLKGSKLLDTFETGYTYDGTTENGLNKLLTTIDYKWFIDDNQFYVLPNEVALTTIEVPLLSEDTGLYAVERRVNKKDSTVRFILNCALLNNVKLGGKVSVQDPLLNGVFKIDKIKTSGHYIGDVWDTVLEVSEETREPT